jgi:hypothetical protein
VSALLPFGTNDFSACGARQACEFLEAILSRPADITAGVDCDQEGALWCGR